MDRDSEVDDAVVRAAIAGDEQARATCFTRFDRAVVAFATFLFTTTQPPNVRRQLSTKMSPEGLAQEAWVRLYDRQWPILDDGGSGLTGRLISWLYATALRVYNNLRKRAWRHPEWELTSSRRESIPAFMTSVASRASRIEVKARVQAAIEAFPSATQIALRGWMLKTPYSELAADLGLSVGALRARVHRALDRLSQWLDPADFGYVADSDGGGVERGAEGDT